MKQRHLWIPITGMFFLLAPTVNAQTPARKAPPARSAATPAKGQPKASAKAQSSQSSGAVASASKAPDVLTSLSKERRAKEIKKMQTTYKKFRKAAREYLNEVRALVRKRYRERRNLIAGGYEARIKVLEKK